MARHDIYEHHNLRRRRLLLLPRRLWLLSLLLLSLLRVWWLMTNETMLEAKVILLSPTLWRVLLSPTTSSSTSLPTSAHGWATTCCTAASPAVSAAVDNSTSKDSVRAEPYLQRTTQSLEAKNEMCEWTFGECMCDTNEPCNETSKTERRTTWKLVSRVSSNSASSDSLSHHLSPTSGTCTLGQRLGPSGLSTSTLESQELLSTKTTPFFPIRTVLVHKSIFKDVSTCRL